MNSSTNLTLTRMEQSQYRLANSSNPTKDVFPEKKRIALVAHDKNKEKLVEWCKKWKSVLSNHSLMGTGTTAGKVCIEKEVDIMEISLIGQF